MLAPLVRKVVQRGVQRPRSFVDRPHQTPFSTCNKRVTAQFSSSMFPWPEQVKKPVGKAQTPEDEAKTILFSPMKLRDLELKNRIIVSPMCMYSSTDGFMTDFHLVHLGQFALGGAGLIIMEATAVSPEGRISPFCNGLWKDEHMEMQKRIVNFVHQNEGRIGVQLAHAGRKASTIPPFYDYGRPGQAVSEEEGGWTVVAPSAIPFSDDYPKPVELSLQEIDRIKNDFKAAAKRALEVGYDLVEIHGAHGYLITTFCSPLSNHRTDQYGGSFENRVRFALETVDAVRSEWPLTKPLSIRLSCTDWAEGGWTSEDTVKLVGLLKQRNVDIIDCSTGGTVPGVKYPVGPGYQIQFSEDVKKAHDDIATGTVGVIVAPEQAEEALQKGQADFVLLAREFLRDPHWPLRAANALKVNVHYPPQYERSRRPIR